MTSNVSNSIVSDVSRMLASIRRRRKATVFSINSNGRVRGKTKPPGTHNSNPRNLGPGDIVRTKCTPATNAIFIQRRNGFPVENPLYSGNDPGTEQPTDTGWDKCENSRSGPRRESFENLFQQVYIGRFAKP